MSSGAAFAAGSGYAPGNTSPVPTGTPGGFSQVVTVQTITPSTSPSTITTQVQSVPISIQIPAGAFGSQTVQVVITQPNLNTLGSSLPSLGYSGKNPVAGFGFSVVNPTTGQYFTGTFAQPIVVKVDDPSFTPQDEVLEISSTGVVSIDRQAQITSGSITLTFSSDPGFAVLAPASASSVPGATTPVTGKNFLPEGLLAGGLIAGGSVLIVVGARKRRSFVAQ